MQFLESNDAVQLDDIKFSAFLSLRQAKREQNLASKESALKITRQIPMQLLASEWFNQIDPSTEMRAYLIENFLPILVLGCEKVLNEAQAHDLISQNRKHDDFNPINFLAQFLMRNNPRYNNNNESSPYVKTMRELYEQLREQMLFIQGNKLAKVKEEVRRKRNERKAEESLRKIEGQRRKDQIERLFSRFYLDQNGRLELLIINEVFKVLKGQVENLSVKQSLEIKLDEARLAKYCLNKDGINYQRRLLRHEFVECISLLSDHLTSDLFDLFLELFDNSAASIVNLAKENNLDKITNELVQIMDPTKSGFLIRKRVIQVLKQFLDKNKKLNLHEPLEWPVQDPAIKFESRSDQKSLTSSFVQRADVESGIFAEENRSSPKTLMSAKASLDLTNPPPNKVAFEDVESTNPEVNAQDQAEIVSNQESESQNANPVQDEAKTSLKSLNEDEEIVRKESATNSAKKLSLDLPLNSIENEIEKAKNDARNTELMFLKDGVLYYNPLKEPLKAFDSSFFAEKLQLTKQEPNSQDIQYDFNSKLVNSKQFANLIRSYLSTNLLDSEIYINEFISFVRENYSETAFERELKLKQIKSSKELENSIKTFNNCFEKLDNEGSGVLPLSYLTNCLEAFRMGIFKEQISKVKSEFLNAYSKEEVYLSKNDFFNFMMAVLRQLSNSDISSPYQEQLVSHLNSFSMIDADKKARGENRKQWLKQIKYVGDVCLGSFEPLYKQLFLTILKDAENYGSYKMMSSYVGILEKLPTENGSIEVVLRYHASTPNDSRLILGKILTRSIGPVSFEAVDKGDLIHIPRVRSNPNVFFFNSENNNDGSLLIYPLKISQNNVFGVIGIDTLQQNQTLSRASSAKERESNASYFNDDEIKFYQGVAGSFSEAYVSLIFKNRLIKCCRSSIEWLFKTCNQKIESVSLYFVQRLDSSIRLDFDPVETKANVDSKINVKKIVRFEFREVLKTKMSEEKAFTNVDYYLGSKLYECAVLSETTVSQFGGKTSFYVPLRNQTQKTVLIMEIEQKENAHNDEENEDDKDQMDSNQMSEIESVLHVLYKCQQSLIDEHFQDVITSSKEKQFEYEILFEEEKFAILFEKCFIEFVLNNLSKHLNLKLEMSSTASSSASTTQLLTSFLQIVADLIDNDELKETQIIDENVISMLKSLDPTRREIEEIIFEKINRYNISVQDLIEFYKNNLVFDPLKSLLEWFLLILDMKARKESFKSSWE